MPGSQRVYIGNIGSDIRERDIEKFFKGFGKLGDISLKNGYGFVDFEDHRDASDAVHELDGKDCRGSRIRVELARDNRRDRDGGDRRDRGGRGGGGRFGGDRGGGRFGGRDDRGRGGGGDRRGNAPGPKTKYRCVVENISAKTTWQDLKDYFRACGEVTYTNAHKMKQGEGIVEFGDRRALDYALEHLNNSKLDGVPIKVVAETIDGRPAASSGGSGSSSRKRRSRSRSKSRSRSRSERSRS